ncbi:hypothetical protein [Acaryochloris sp. IP29b_bin.148]|uniref:hypothetical protein n=1 Tax=Acaryochloris sp. IP29b_bin.148 TaxID=2969218 RepID=UPI00262229FA|nr:hypothetical protein [Acaryochloris sp. IP29b_bin.148]
MFLKPVRFCITPKFLSQISKEGALALAASRLANQSAPKLERLTQLSTWSLICEEIVDTEYNEQYYERVVNELLCRGLKLDEIQDMRLLAWETAGWLNFEMRLWEWVSLDETDIFRAIDWLRTKREISESEVLQLQQQVVHYQKFDLNPK